MYKTQYKNGNKIAAYIGENLLIVNTLTKKYFIEKNSFFSKYLIYKIFHGERVYEDEKLQEYSDKIITYLDSVTSIIDEDRIIYFEITNNCNLRCIHCYNNSNDKNNLVRKELPIDKIENVIVANKSCENLKVILSGGEPILHSQFKMILDMLRKYDVKTTVYSNGINIDKYASLFIGTAENIMISFDGADSEKHDMVRGEGSFIRTTKNVELLCEKLGDNRVFFSFTINKYNYQTAKEMLELSTKYNVKKVYLNPVAALGRNHEDSLGLNDAELVEFWDVLYELKDKYKGIEIICDTYWKAGYLAKNAILPYDCSICRKIRISVDGYVYPCTFFDDKSIMNRNIEDNQDVFGDDVYNVVKKNVNDRLFKCEDCVFITLCNGGCPAAGYKNGIWGISEVECDAKTKFFRKHIEMIKG